MHFRKVPLGCCASIGWLEGARIVMERTVMRLLKNNPATDYRGGELETSGGSGERFRFRAVRLSDGLDAEGGHKKEESRMTPQVSGWNR